MDDPLRFLVLAQQVVMGRLGHLLEIGEAVKQHQPHGLADFSKAFV